MNNLQVTSGHDAIWIQILPEKKKNPTIKIRQVHRNHFNRKISRAFTGNEKRKDFLFIITRKKWNCLIIIS